MLGADGQATVDFDQIATYQRNKKTNSFIMISNEVPKQEEAGDDEWLVVSEPSNLARSEVQAVTQKKSRTSSLLLPFKSRKLTKSSKQQVGDHFAVSAAN